MKGEVQTTYVRGEVLRQVREQLPPLEGAVQTLLTEQAKLYRLLEESSRLGGEAC